VVCYAGDAVTTWASEGYGLSVGPAARGHLNAVPVLDRGRPVGFTFAYVCMTHPTCNVQHRIICADLTLSTAGP
jgi:hypothetical protein